MENSKIVKSMRKIKLIDLGFSLYFKYKEVINYLIFGVLTTIVNITGYFILARVFHAHYMLSTIIALVVSILFAYVTNKLFVFEHSGKNIIKEIISFFSFRFLSSLIDIADMYIFVEIFHFDDMFVKIASNALVIVLNYVFSKLFVFKKEPHYEANSLK